jgi:hypothetical protein
MKERVLNVLKANKGHIISISGMVNALDLKTDDEKYLLNVAIDELVCLEKIKHYISLPKEV